MNSAVAVQLCETIRLHLWPLIRPRIFRQSFQPRLFEEPVFFGAHNLTYTQDNR